VKKVFKELKELPIVEKIILALFMILYLSSKVVPEISHSTQEIQIYMTTYFSENRLGLIVNITFILIGIYATITSVFGSTNSTATSRLAEKGLTLKYIKYIALAILSAFILPLYIIFIDNKNVYLLIFLLVWLITCLIRFLIIILLMYYYNVETSQKIDKDEYENYNKMMDVLTQISIDMKNQNK